MIFKKNLSLFMVTLFSLGMVQLVAMGDSFDAAKAAGLAASLATGSSAVGGAVEKGAQQVIDTLNDPELTAKLEKKAHEAAKIAQKKAKAAQEDLGNIATDYIYSMGNMKSPAISKQAAIFSMQKKYPEAQAFRKKATSPYYGYGVTSATIGTTLLATAPFSRDSMTSAKLGVASLVVSLGCYYKTRCDLASLKKNIEKDCAAKKLQHLYKQDKDKFNNTLHVNISAKKVIKKLN